MDQAEFDQRMAANPYLLDIAYRLEMLAQNEAVQQGGPSKGQANKLKAELDAMKTDLDSLKNAPAGSAPSYQGTVTLTPK